MLSAGEEEEEEEEETVEKVASIHATDARLSVLVARYAISFYFGFC